MPATVQSATADDIGRRDAEGDVTADEVREFYLSNLVEDKHPRVVAFVDELPQTASGKVQKFELVEREAE